MKNRNDYLKIPTLVMLILSLIVLTIGISFAAYSKFIKGDTTNIIESGRISFSYDEDEFKGNGINITEALPVSDNVGKVLNGTGQYFDFSINAFSSISDINYRVILLKQGSTTLEEKYVKTYLTLRNGGVETASDLVIKNGNVATFDQLPSSEEFNGKVIYNGTVKVSDNEYHQDFRLRMWISSNIDGNYDFTNKSFSVKVKVEANEI